MRKPSIVISIVLTTVVALSDGEALAGGDSPSAGSETYTAKCASCHGKDGSGSTAIGKKMGLRDLRSPDVQKQTDQQLYDIIAKGKKKMPAYEKKLSAQEIKDLVTHIRSLAKN